MFSKLKEVRDALVEFVHQDRYPVLVIRASDVELIYILKILEGLDQGEPAHVFGVFSQPVSADARDYVTSLIKAMHGQLEPVNQVRVAEGNPPWPVFPPECDDVAVAPTRRLRSGVAHVAGLVPGGVEHRLVFCLLPLAIIKPGAYAESISALLPLRHAAPADAMWPRVRLILRDDGNAPMIIQALRRSKNPDVLVYEPDLSPPALMDAMAREVVDPTLPEAQRMQLLTELASLDYAYGRLDEASAKYEVLYEYYGRQHAPVMQAFVLQGAGDVFRRIGRVDLARERYGQGLTLAISTQALPLIRALAFAAGDVSLELRRFQDAEDHLEIARKIAVSQHDRPVEADTLEKIGDARIALERPAEAMSAWRDAAAACRLAAYKDRLVSVLERMANTFAAARMESERRICENELSAVRGGAPIRAPERGSA